MYIEGFPFHPSFESLGGHTYDSVVGVVGNKWILKWPRRRIYEPEIAHKIAHYLKLAINLYKKALGPNFIVPTQVVIGEKVNGRGKEFKPYVLQPYINSYPLNEWVNNDCILNEISLQWMRLRERLFYLYIVAREVNKKLPYDQRFFIGMTVGRVRQATYEAKDLSSFNSAFPSPPHTPNILIDRDTPHILLPDFGPYYMWKKSMSEAYQRILNSLSLDR